ncbi:MAG TPA: DUF4062 domain-containing protein [Pyrinomonadaceae bacterium]|nr:DUF4062 domain-containing protein [Pyrinomonadaceae bacterium]
MAQTTNTFRIFVSSTFSDLHIERNALREFVFPRLHELCLQNGCRFQAIDLRWGVSADAGRDQKTMQICLEEIKRCQRVTPRPNFIVLLGDRYGWCPLPEEILADEFEKILEFISDDEKKDLLWDEKKRNGWYRLDENTKPPFYCLQPREGKYAEYSVWEKVERKLHAILENATVDFDEKTRTKYVASATEQEINQGLEDEQAMEHVFCFFRSFSNQDKFSANFTEQAGKFFEFDKNKQPNEIANRKLANLKKRLRDTLPKQNVHDYSAQWLENSDSDMPHTTDHIGTLPDNLEDCLKLLDEDPKTANLCVDVWRQLAPAILEEIGKIKKVSDVKKEKDDHEKFGTDRAKHFVGRTDYLDKIREYVEADNRRQPLCLWGESGSGKSALMAYAAEQIKDDLVVRFIGATPPSSDIRALLESLCQEISEKYDADKTTIPADYNELVKEFPKRLELDKKGKRMVLFLDALDQISEAENAQNLRWLPENLPENVHLIVSTLPNDSLDILRRRLPADNIIELEPMPKDEGDKVLDLWLSDKKRTLQDWQRAEILNKFAANGLPLYLKFAFEEARLWHSYDEIKPLATDVEGIIGDLFTRLSDEANHGAMMVKCSLGYLAAARYGLTEDELLQVLSIDKQVMDDFKDRSKKTPEVDSLPVVVWSRLYFDLEPYLTERAGANADLLSFYHRQLGEVTAQKYLSGDDKKRAHKHLADYFELQDYWQETPAQYRNRVGEFPKSARRANQRKASELAFQLRQFGDYERLEQIHTNLDFLEAKTAAGLVFELAKDFTKALKIIPRPQQRIIRLLEEALRREIHFIARHGEDYPQALFQCLWNYGWWYDCPQAANHYEEKDGPWSRTGAKLYQLLEKWRKQKEVETPGFRWLCSLRPPQHYIDSDQVAVFSGHTGRILSVVISDDNQRIFTGSVDGTFRVWDFETGEEMIAVKFYDGDDWITSIVISKDGRWVISEYQENIMRVWDMEIGQELKAFFGHSCLGICSDNQHVVITSQDGTVRDWNMKTNEEFILLTHDDSVNPVAFSPNNKYIIEGSRSFSTVRKPPL